MESNQFVEKRIHPRVSIQIPLKIRLIEDPMGMTNLSDLRKREINSKTLDASLGGMFISSEEKLNLGSIMSMNFSLPEFPVNISAFAEVVWSNNNGSGVHFLALKEDDLASLKFTLAKISMVR